MIAKCPGCGNPLREPVEGQPRPWYWLDGTRIRLCRECVKEWAILAGHREDVRR